MSVQKGDIKLKSLKLNDRYLKKNASEAIINLNRDFKSKKHSNHKHMDSDDLREIVSNLGWTRRGQVPQSSLSRE